MKFRIYQMNQIFLILLVLATGISGQHLSSDHIIISGGANLMSGYLAPAVQGQDRVTGTVTVVVGQPFVSPQAMTGNSQVMELGYWSQLKRTPGIPEFNASYDIYPGRIDLDWNYDPNTPPATISHRIYRGGSGLIRDNYSVNNTVYEDDAPDLDVGTEYNYELEGRNSFGWAAENAQTVGKTSTVGSITGKISTALGTNIPNAKVVLTPNWGHSLFLNGTSNYITIPDADIFDVGDHSVLPEATVELWLKPTEVANEPILSKGTDWALSLVNTGGFLHLEYKLSGSRVLLTDATISVDEWTHIILKKELQAGITQISIFINGQLAMVEGGQTSMTVTSHLSGNDALRVGHSGSEYFRGFIDDIRIWDMARNNIDLSRDYDRYLYYRTLGDINYPHLRAHLTMDNGSGAVITNAVNQALNGTYVELTQDTWSTTRPPAYATDYTDLSGNYAINNINYGNGTNFTLTPSKAYHEFDPTYRLVYLSDIVPVANGQNFSVTNLMSITGYVYYDTENTNDVQCGEQHVQIWVNDEFKGVLTDASGFYRVEVEPGADVKIQPVKASRETIDFDPYELNYTNVIANKTANFVDLKTRTLRGSVTGGACEYALGPANLATVTLTPASQLFSKTVAVQASGDYEFTNIPPQAYSLSVDINVAGSYTPSIPGGVIVMGEYFANNGKTINTEDSFSLVDSTWSGEEDTVKFNYRSDMKVSLSGFDENQVGDNMVTQNIEHTLTLFAYEEYWGNPVYNQCPIDSGSFIIFDYISDRWTPSSDTVRVEFGADGTHEYAMLPGKPNISPDGAYPYHKTIEIMAEDAVGRRKSLLDRAVVLGHRPQQMDFTTTAPDIPLLILRRPPGDASSSTFSSTQSQCTELEISTSETVGNQVGMTAKLGLGVTTSIGFVVMTEISVEAHYEIESGLSMSQTQTSSTSQSLCVECETSYSTGELMGSDGDLFVGGALNLLYGVTKVLSLEDMDGIWVYTLTDEIIFVPNGFETTYIYTRAYIEKLLIPELLFLAETDSTMLESASRWQDVLVREDSLRWITQDTTNYSFEGGAGEFSVSRASEVTQSVNYSTELQLDVSLAQTVGFSVNDASGFDATFGYNFGFGMGKSSTSTTTQTNSSSFSLDDNDFGDDYTVGVGSDPVYGTPVFHVIAGHSSCPYEAWENEQGAVVTIPRDVPYMEWQTPSTMNNVMPNQAALLTVLLRNDQEGEAGSDARTYYLSTVESSNPRGAVVLINGQEHDQLNPLPYTLGIGESDTAQIAVSQGEGDYYEYENLLLKFAPECESQSSVTQGFALPFTVNYARPCTEAEIYDPGEDWVVNLTHNDTLDLIVTSYDLGQGHFDELKLQYRQLGGDTWFTVDNATLVADTLREYDQHNALMRWPVEVLNDGIYDLRLRSVCLEGLLTNEMPALRGTIDREVPTVLGAPEPVDNVLNMNDEIAINFTEPINPASVQTNNIILFDGQGQGRITDIEVSVSENRLVISPMVANDQIENHYLEASISGYQDIYGNPGDTVSWAFQVNKNPISWNVPSFNTIAWVGDDQGFDITLNNIGASVKPFEIVDLPAWLTAVPAEGEINAGGSFDIHFDIDPNLNVGEYSQIVYADTPDGLEPLDIDVISMCHYPDWSFDPNFYQYNMNVTARLFIQGTRSLDTYDRIGAFVEGEPRGFANIQYSDVLDEYFAYLTIYSNIPGGEEIDLHIWDRTGCAEYWEVDTTLTFVMESIVGTPSAPANLNANGAIGQELDLESGFTWFSLNLDGAASTDLDLLFEDMALTAGDRILSHIAFAQYSATSESWSGTLASLDLGKMYIADLDTAGQLDLIGFPVNADVTEIEVAAGWNWVGYLPSENIGVNQSLASLSSTTDDLVKDQYNFAQYIEDYGWFGSLQWMRPDYGYKLKLAAPDTLIYPAGVAGRQLALSKSHASRAIQSGQIVNYNFANNMTATLQLEGGDPNNEVLAFVGEEVRGRAVPLYLPTLDIYRVFMMIYGETGETVRFEVHEMESEIVYQGNEILTFNPDEVMGSPLEPMLLSRVPLGIGDIGYIPDVYSLEQNFPNPFNPFTKIGFGIPEDARVSVKIYNLRGQEVKTLVDDDLHAGYRFVVWNSTGNQGSRMTSGVYFVVMETSEFREVRKMLLLK